MWFDSRIMVVYLKKFIKTIELLYSMLYNVFILLKLGESVMTNVKQNNMNLVDLYINELEKTGKSLNTRKNYVIDLKSYVNFLQETPIPEATTKQALEFRN